MDPVVKMEQQLWEYIDGICSVEEQAFIAHRIEIDPIWQKRYEELLQLNVLLKESELQVPSMRFTKNVMDAITQSQLVSIPGRYVSNKVIGSIAFFFIAVIAAAIIYAIRYFSFTGNEKPVITQYLDRMFSNSTIKIILFINAILALFLFDTFLSAKKKSVH